MSNKRKIGATTSKVHVVTGTTVALKDGKTRDITLVAVVETEEVEDRLRTVKDRVEGNKHYFVTMVETLRFTKTTVRIGLAVVSPVDKAFTEAYEYAKKVNNVGQLALLEKSKSGSLVTPERGVEIAAGKASKRKTAIATIVTDAPFFGKTMISVILKEKIRQICEDPDRFIKVTPVPEVKEELAQKENIAGHTPNSNKHSEGGKFVVREVEHA